MTDAHNQFAFLTHGIDKFHRMLTSIIRLAELAGGSVQSSAKTIALKNVLYVNKISFKETGSLTYNSQKSGNQ